MASLLNPTPMVRNGATSNSITGNTNNLIGPVHRTSADDGDKDHEDYSKKPKENFLETITATELLKQDLDDGGRKLFDKMICYQKPDGGPLILFHAGSNRPSVEMFYDGAVGVPMLQDSRPDDKENIDNTLKAAVLAKSAHPDGVYISAPANIDHLITAKACELAGLKVKNPLDATLDKVHPELAGKMEQEWAVLHSKPDQLAIYAAKKTDLSSLVKTPSSLDNAALSVRTSFASAAAQLPSTSPNLAQVNADPNPSRFQMPFQPSPR